ncbi:hypothetical protein ACVWZR_005299 [Bradyrhizobium sp. i1.3.1]
MTISRVTHSPPCSRNMVRCTPGSNFTSSTDASVTQPLSTVRVITSVLDVNGMTTLIRSFVTGSKIIFTSFATTASATFSGMTNPNISTKNLLRSGCPSFNGRYIIGRVSPTAANEKPPPMETGACAVVVWACALATSGTENAGSAASAPRTRRRLGSLGQEDCIMITPDRGEGMSRRIGRANSPICRPLSRGPSAAGKLDIDQRPHLP